MGRRRGRMLLASGAAALALTTAIACTPTPAPSPTPTGFASAEEAFAAAEATYRAYVDAVNHVDLATPSSFEGVYQHLANDALNAAMLTFSDMHAKGWVVNGSSTITVLEPSKVELNSVTLAVCLDVSEVALADRYGVSQVENRPREQSIEVVVVAQHERWAITSFAGRQGTPECVG